MSFTKTKIYNLALSALLVGKELSDVDTDTSNEVRVLNTHYDVAFESTLQDLDLDSHVNTLTLELLENLTGVNDETWDYVYKYPSNCIFFRRIINSVNVDDRSTHISKRTALRGTNKVIYTNESTASIEYIPKDIPLATLSPMAGLAVAYKLAILSAPLLVGKGAKSLRKEINELYITAKGEAQETDVLENFVYDAEYQRSEFVRARLE